MIPKYYVYILCDPRYSGEKWGQLYKPFYVGKGSGRRAIRHLEESTKKNVDNVRKYYKIKKIRSENLEPTIVYYATNLDENEAYLIEETLIKRYGRKDFDENGILTNFLLDGGRPPLRCGPMSETQKAAIAKGNTGKKRTTKQSERLSQIRRGQKRGAYSETHRNSISKSLGGNIAIDLKNTRRGQWLVLDIKDDRRSRKRRGAPYIFWKCRCSCIKATERYVNQSRLQTGLSTSCGCKGRNKDIQ